VANGVQLCAVIQSGEVVGAALGNHRDPEQHRGILLLYCGGAVFDLGTQLGAAWHHC